MFQKRKVSKKIHYMPLQVNFPAAESVFSPSFVMDEELVFIHAYCLG